MYKVQASLGAFTIIATVSMLTCRQAPFDTPLSERQQTTSHKSSKSDNAMDIEKTFHYAVQLYESGNSSGALRKFETILRDAPNYTGALYMAGKINAEYDQLEIAMERLTKACSNAPNNYDILIELSDVQCRLGQRSESDALLTRAIQVDGSRGEAYNNKAIAFYDDGEVEKAIEAFNDGLKHSVYVPLLKGRALAHMEAGHYSNAIDDLTECISRFPKVSVFYWYRSQCYEELDQLGLAIEDAESSIKLAPNDSDFIEHRNDLREKVRTLHE